MKRFQAQLRGRPAMARRSFTQQEWEQFMELVWGLDDPQIRLCASAYFPFMLHYITRLDDASKTYVHNLTGYRRFANYAIMSKICWSKNVLEERDCPFQLMFGAMDVRYDLPTAFGLWLEWRFEHCPHENVFVFCVDGLEDPVRIKEKLRRVLDFVIGSDVFVLREVGLVGTHSIRKFAVSFARGQGCVLVSLFCHVVLLKLVTYI